MPRKKMERGYTRRWNMGAPRKKEGLVSCLVGGLVGAVGLPADVEWLQCLSGPCTTRDYKRVIPLMQLLCRTRLHLAVLRDAG